MPVAVDARDPWERWGWAFACIWLVFLVYPITESLQVDKPDWLKAFSVVCCVIFGVVNVVGYGLSGSRAVLVFAAMLLLAGATVPVIGIEAVGFTPYLGMMAALNLPDRWWKQGTALAALLPLFSLLGGERFPLWFFLMVWPIIVAGVLIRLFTARERIAETTRHTLAVTSERERVARDVHDVLGHSLTALSVKAELAARLIDLDPERAKVELASIQETARQALAEVRATVGGLRAGNLDAELAAAPRVLADAGVATSVEGSVDETDPRHRALLAWVLRECVTNVVRHADASHVTISLDAGGMTVADDGRGLDAPEGNGMTGMRERVSAAGGTLEISGAPGTSVSVSLP